MMVGPSSYSRLSTGSVRMHDAGLDQALSGVLQAVASRHNLISFIAMVSTQLLSVILERSKQFQPARNHPLPNFQDPDSIRFGTISNPNLDTS